MKLKSPLTPLALSLGLLLATHSTNAQMCLAKNLGNTGTAGVGGQCSTTSTKPNRIADLLANHPTTTAPTSSAFAPNTFVSNPINVLSGNKFEQADDLIIDETDPYALNLTRYYNSQSTQRGMFGIGWRSGFEIQLQHTTHPNQTNQHTTSAANPYAQNANRTNPNTQPIPQTDTIQILSTDGTLYHFYKTEVRDKDNPTLKHTHYTHPDPSLGYIKEVQNNLDGEHWHWHLPDGRRFGFVLHKQANQQAQRLNKAHHHTTKQPTAHTATHTYGQLSSVYQNPQKPHLGHYQLRYDTKGRLAKVTNHQRQSISFTYQTTKHNLPYITVQSPIGTSHYFLDKHHNLSQVVSPNGTRTGYGYTDPNDKHNLTAKYHYANQASGTTPNQNQAILVQSWVYDEYDRAILSTEPNGQNKVSIRYDDSLWHAYQTNHYTNQHNQSTQNKTNQNQQNQKTYINTLTNSLGQTTQYHYTYTPQTGFRLIKAVGAGCSTCDESTINHSFVYDDKGRVITRTALDSTNPAKSIHTTHIRYDDTSNIKEVIDTPNNPPTDQPNNTPNPNPNPNTPNPVFYQRFEYQNPKHPTKPTKLIRPSVVKGKEVVIELDYDDDGDVVTMTQRGYVPTTPKQGNQTTAPNTQNSQTDSLQTYQTKFSYAIQDNQKRLIGKTTKSSQDDLVHSEHYDYDQQGNLIAIHHGKDKQASEHFAYQNSPHGKQLTKHTSIQGIDTHYTYNKQGLITHIKRNSSNNTNNTNSEFIQIDYDNQNRPIVYHNHLNQSVKVSYDTINNTNNIADNPQVGTTTHTITYTFDDGNSITQSYDSEQNLLDEYTSTSRQIKTTANQHKIDNQNATSLASVLQQANTHSQSKDQASTNAKHNNTNPIILSLDVFGRLDTLTLPQGSSYTRQYDDFGNLIAHTDANTGTHSLSHNIHHLPTLIQDENTTTAITYNELKMPTKRQACQTQKTNESQAQDCQTVSYHYDNKHRPTHINDQHQNTTYVYDDKGNVIKTEVSLTTTTHTTAYQYDSLGRITHTHLPEGITLIHHYDKHSQTTSIDYQLPNTSVWQTLARSLMGNKNQNPLLPNIKTSSTQGLVSFTYTNNTTQVNVYDQQDRLQTKHDHTTSTKLSYGINSNNPNNLSQITSIDTNGNIINIDELTNAYTYDSNGNRTKHHHTHYTYEPNSDRLSRIENDNTIITYQYDKQGNPITITITSKQDNTVNTRHLDYTPDGQIKSIKDNDKLIATYQYNHLRQRIAKTTYYKDHQTNQTKEETTQYLWDKGLLSAEIKDDKVVRRYIYLDIMPVSVLDYGYDEKGKLNETKVYSVHTDHLGTPKAITNKNQETVWQIDLDTFGETKSIQSKDNFQFNLRFAGQYFDQESGYHYNYHRYYDPKVGRYLTSDPIGLNGGSLNTYAYAYNRPYMASDVYGLYTIFIGGAMDHEPFQLVPGTPAIGSATWIIRRVRDGFRNNFLVGHFKSLGYSNYYALAKKNSRYYGFNEIDKALTDAKMYLSAQGNENAKINIVGHSLGGWQAAHLSAQISRFRCGSVDNLITLDPVGTDLGLRATQRKFIAASPKPKANFWINIRAEQLKTIVDPLNHYDNIIANAGGQWDPLMDDFLFPDRSYQLNVGHGNASKMMKTGILYKGQELTETPWSILKKSYINKGKAESFISVPDQPDNRGLETK